jgi:hypothetical protein
MTENRPKCNSWFRTTIKWELLGEVMPKLVVLFAFLSVLLTSVASWGQNYLDEPEGIVYDSVYNRYLVSCWRNGAVIEIDSNGVQGYFRSGLGNCASIIISGDTVFVPVNNNSVVGLDLVTGVTVMYRNFPGAIRCHDVAVDTSGYLYATNRDGHIIYRVDLSDNSYIIYADYSDGIYEPSGIEYDIFNNRLIVVPMVENHAIKAANLSNGIVTEILNPGLPALDGIARDHLGNYYITTFTGGLNSIYRFDSTFTRTPELIQEGFNGLVDVCFNRQQNILAATEYFEDTVHYIPIYGSVFLENHEISDTLYGDGDGVPEGGETIELTVELFNSGVETVSNLLVSLAVDDPSINIISGSASIGDLSVQSTVSNSGSPFLIEIPYGYVPRLNTFLIETQWESNFGSETDLLEFHENIGGCSILLVDDDNGDNVEAFFIECFDRAALPYDIIEAPPSLTELNSYDIVVWFTGDSLNQPLDGDEIDSLAAFLDGGGKLFLTGQYIASALDVLDPDFLNNYLKSEYTSSSLIPVLQAEAGGQVFDPSDEVSIYGDGGANNQMAPGHLNAINGGLGEMNYLGFSDLGAVSYDGTHQLVFFAFGFEAIVNGDSRWVERDVILAEILDFFGYQMPEIPIALAVSPGDPMHLVDHLPEISWEHGDPDYAQTQHHVQVGSDNDWTSAEMWDYGPISGTETAVVYAGTELFDGMTYYYRVSVYDGFDWSHWYYGQMRMNSLPSIPAGLSPDDMAEIDTTLPDLSHINAGDNEDDILTYSYELYEDEPMSLLVAQESDYPQESGGITVWPVPTALPDGEDYYWRARAYDSYEFGDWSSLASFYIIAAYVCGDANGDETVNVADAVFVINYVFKGGPAPESLEAGDANADGQCNVADAVYLINYVFKGGPDPVCP